VVSEEERSRLLEGYGVLPDAYDELVDGSGAPRAHARLATEMLAGLTPDGFQRCQSLAELSDTDLIRLLGESQPSFTSPEAGYTK